MKEALRYLWKGVKDTYTLMCEELWTVLHDKGVLIIFLGAGLAYPVLYGFIYWNEAVHDLPVAVVDDSHSQLSRRFVRMMDATPDVAVAYKCMNMGEAQELYAHGDVVGIVRIPKEFHQDIMAGRQTHVSAYANMASMLYYKALYAATNYVALEMGGMIQVSNMVARGTGMEQAVTAAAPVRTSTVALFNPKSGYASFLLPCVLILVIQQTLVIGVGMLSGTRREENPNHNLVPGQRIYHKVHRLVLGRALAYFLIYMLIGFYNLALIPSMFDVPHNVSFANLIGLLLPLVLSCTFFAMALSVFFYNRVEVFLIYLFSTLPLLFMSGVLWPSDSMPEFWREFAAFFPSTMGIRAFVKLTSMGADFSQVTREVWWMWIQAGGYFVVTLLAYRWQIIAAEHNNGIRRLMKRRIGKVINKQRE